MNRLLEKIINRTHLQDAQKADYCGFCFKHSGGHNGKRISHIRNFQVFCLPTERKLLSFWPIHAHITCAALKGVGDPPPPLENSNFIKLHSKIPENMSRVPPLRKTLYPLEPPRKISRIRACIKLPNLRRDNSSLWASDRTLAEVWNMHIFKNIRVLYLTLYM